MQAAGFSQAFAYSIYGANSPRLSWPPMRDNTKAALRAPQQTAVGEHTIYSLLSRDRATCDRRPRWGPPGRRSSNLASPASRADMKQTIESAVFAGLRRNHQECPAAPADGHLVGEHVGVRPLNQG